MALQEITCAAADPRRKCCQSNEHRLQTFKLALKGQRQQTWVLAEGLKRCSPLSVLLDMMRRQQLGLRRDFA